MFITDAVAATVAPIAAPPAAHAAKGVFPPFDSATFAGQLFWLAITFGALYIIMSRVALPRVAAILETRRARIASDLDTAAAAEKQANEAGAAYEKTLADAKASAQKNIQQLNDKLAAETAAKRAALEEELNAKMAAAEDTIAATKAQAMTNVSAIATDAAGAIVRQITGREPDAAAVARAVAATNG